jgi:hypothetical protein
MRCHATQVHELAVVAARRRDLRNDTQAALDVLLAIDDRASRAALLSGGEPSGGGTSTHATPSADAHHRSTTTPTTPTTATSKPTTTTTTTTSTTAAALVDARDWQRLLRAARRVESASVPLPASSLHANAAARPRRRSATASTTTDVDAAAAKPTAGGDVQKPLFGRNFRSPNLDSISDSIDDLAAPAPRSDALLLSLVTSSPLDVNHRAPSKYVSLFIVVVVVDDDILMLFCVFSWRKRCATRFARLVRDYYIEQRHMQPAHIAVGKSRRA